MSPRQMLRAFEVRAIQNSPAGQQTERQVQSSPDAPGLHGQDLEDYLNTVVSRIRLNAGATDWRLPPVGGEGGTGQRPRVLESPEGERDGVNTTFQTSASFAPQTLRLYVNGLLQVLQADGNADYTVSESQGVGTGYDRVTLAWAPLAQDRILADYQPGTP